LIEERTRQFGSIRPRDADKEGDTEALSGVTFTHHLVDSPGDYETVRYHYIESEPVSGETIVFRHGIPDSWFQWFHQMADFAKSGYHCVAVDLKSYGQSEKKPGDYRHEGVAEELYVMMKQIGLTMFNLRMWKCPIMIIQGYESKSQPMEFYEKARDYIPNASKVDVSYLPRGHFWTLESPKETTEAIRELLAM
jgi:pimeloyl-ACP methyl ester carboxylesterase